MSAPGTDKPVIGLVGGIGAGKSTVAAKLAKLGCAVIDGDAIGQQVLNDPTVRQTIRGRWGEAVFSAEGIVDRRKLGEIVFADPRQLEHLNTFTHDPIGKRIAEAVSRHRAEPAVKAIVLDAAVLLEAGWDKFCTHLVYVDADAETRCKRAEAAKGWPRGAWTAREKSQISLDKKREKCQYYVDNSSSVSRLGEHVRGIFREIVRSADCS